jgi:hypothetical protein
MLLLELRLLETMPLVPTVAGYAVDEANIVFGDKAACNY